jgi:hypothetical protein
MNGHPVAGRLISFDDTVCESMGILAQPYKVMGEFCDGPAGFVEAAIEE